MNLKMCKVGDLVRPSDLDVVFEIVAVNKASVNLRGPKNSRIGLLKGVVYPDTTFMFVNPKYLRRVKL